MMTTPTKYDDTIDSRDILARIDELEGWAYDGSASEEDRVELAILQALASEASCSPDWLYGEALIRDSYFREYAMDLADDIGAILDELRWPTNCIDWDRAAQELQTDYFDVDFDGVTYWIRG
jgi:hypothetical protein